MYKAIFISLLALVTVGCAKQKQIDLDFVSHNLASNQSSQDKTVNMQWIESDPKSPVILISNYRYAFAPKKQEESKSLSVLEKTVQKAEASLIEAEKPKPKKSATTIKIVPLDVRKHQENDSSAPVTKSDNDHLLQTLGNTEVAIGGIQNAPGDLLITPLPNEFGENTQFFNLPVTILFDLDKSDLRTDARDILNEIPKGARVKLTGYTCDLGSEEHNQALSEQRAAIVADYLEGRGVDVTSRQGKGECCQISKNKEKNRRVEIEEP